jgi:hypothetical protein
MSDQPSGRAADGREEGNSVDAGEPAREPNGEREALDEERPDLDERERRIRTERKPMGPPLPEPEDRGDEREVEVPPEPPTDPA